MRFKLTKKQTWITAVVVGTLAVGGGVFIYTKNLNVNSKQQQEVKPVELHRIPNISKVFVNGKIIPKQTKSYQGESPTGTVFEIYVKDGSSVSKGDALISYKDVSKEAEARSMKEEIRFAEMDIADMRKKLNSIVIPNPIEDIVEEGNKVIINQDQIDSAKQERDSVNSEIANAQRQLQKSREKLENVQGTVITKVYAPFSGTVYVDENTSSSGQEGGSVLTLESTEYFVDGAVSEQDLMKVKVNMPAEINVFSTNQKLNAKVSSISKKPLAEGASTGDGGSNQSQYNLKLNFDKQENVINGLHVQAKILLEKKDMTVPVSAIVTEGDKKFVFIEFQGQARKKEIKATYTDKDVMAVVTEGIKENDGVITNPIDKKIKDGDFISIIGFDDMNQTIKTN